MTNIEGGRRGNRWSPLIWGVLGGLLLIPLVAMQFTDEVKWSPVDFAVMGALLAVVGGGFELALRMSGSPFYRAGAGLAIVLGFLLIWMNLAVGIIGNEDNPLNQMFAGVLFVGFVGALLARFRARGMVWAMVATAGVHGVIAVVAQAYGYSTWVINGGYAALWVASAMLFREAARRQAPKASVSL